MVNDTQSENGDLRVDPEQIGYAQVVKQIGFVLNISLPSLFLAVKRLLSELAFDFTVDLDCMGTEFDFYSQWVLKVFVVPLGLAGICIVNYFKKCKCRTDVHNKHVEKCAQDDMEADLFLVMFLLYPGICNRLFTMFTCRTLDPNKEDPEGQDRSLLYADFRVDCNEPRDYNYMVAAGIAIAAEARSVRESRVELAGGRACVDD